MEVQVFASKIKNKYPQYADIDDAELVNRIVTKYPEYQSQLNQTPPHQQQQAPIQQQTPSVSPEMQQLDQKIEKAEAFNQTLPGKALGALSKIVPGDSYTEDLTERKERLQSQEDRGVSKMGRVKENIIAEGKEIIGDVARFAPYAIPIGSGAKALGAVGKAVVQAGKQAGIISSSKFVEEMSKEADIKESAKKAAEAGVSGGAIALALPLSFQGAKKMVEAFKPVLKIGKQGAAVASEAFNSVPREYYERALDKELSGQSVFKGKWNPRIFNDLGKKAQRAINYVRKEAGKAVGEEAKTLKGAKETIPTNKITSNIDELIEQRTAGGEVSLEPKDMKIINSFKDKLINDPNMSVGKANIIKRQIQNKVKFRTETVDTPSSEGEAILKKIAGDINESIASVSPRFQEVNKKFSDIASLQDKLKARLKDQSVERNIRNLMNDKTALNTQELFRELDTLAPKGMKFMNKLEDSVARAPFEEWFPGRGGGSGGTQGIANIMRAMLLKSTAFVTAPAFSPKTAKKGIQAIGATKRLGELSAPAIKRGLPTYLGMKDKEK